LVDTDIVSRKTFSLLYFKALLSFVAGIGSWLGLSSSWGHHLASSSHWLKARNSKKNVTTRPDLS
jgi:hypothetical protein